MVETLRRRQMICPQNEWELVFTAPAGGLRDPSNTQADLRVAFAAVGYGRVTSHVYRKTVATMMDESGLSARQAADQLGHVKVSMTQDPIFRAQGCPDGCRCAAGDHLRRKGSRGQR